MNKTAIKNFAVWARRKLISEITYKAGLIGITEKGISKPLSMSTDNIQFFDIGTGKPTEISDHEIKQREALVNRIKDKESTSDYKTAFQFVIEEVAYTWFNRLIAIRFMEVNDYLPSRIRVLSSETAGKSEPDMVTTPFDTDMSFSAYEKDRVMQLKHENELDELFRMLFIKQCNKLNEVLPELFERTTDHTELLLTISFTDGDGLVSHLVNDITEEDFTEAVEIIGWMYQYYNTEPKDEVFTLLKKNVKITKERIPAATQLFTPDWIVRYMVENSLGRLWVEGHPNDSLKAEWKYFLEEADQEEFVKLELERIREEYRNISLEELRIIDPCMGSGHILVYVFDVLMQIYESQGYTQRDAAVAIVENNIYGLDIDDRAHQLAYFAIMMKARKYDRRFLTRNISPNIHSIKESNDINKSHLQYFGNTLAEKDRNMAVKQIEYLISALKDVKEYGSILNIDTCDWDLIIRFVSDLNIDGQMSLESIGIDRSQYKLMNIISISKIMAKKYDVVVTNPPYMSCGGMGNLLSEYVKENYSYSKSDLFAVFIVKGLSMLKKDRFLSYITMQSWMFLSSYEVLRNKITNENIISLLQIGFNSFPELNSQIAHAVTFTLRNSSIPEYNGIFFNLNTGKTNDDKNEVYLKKMREKEYYLNKTKEFKALPNVNIAFWLSNNERNAILKSKKLGDLINIRQGLATGNNDKFLRMWFEVAFDDINTEAQSIADFHDSNKKYAPYNKGGDYRRWYGNNMSVIRFDESNYNILSTVGNHLPSKEFYFKRGITWSLISTNNFAARLSSGGFVFDVGGSSGFPSDNYIYYFLGLLCSKVSYNFLQAFNPTINFQVGDIKNIPAIINEESKNLIDNIVIETVNIEKNDWDSNEYSWHFKTHPLINQKTKISGEKRNLISESYNSWMNETTKWFDLVKRNEEELNRLFSYIYKLEDTINPAVEDKSISIIVADCTKTVRSLLSYAVGCMFGRYSLDVDGIAYAGGEWDFGSYSIYKPDKDNCILITDEEYFSDDIVGHFVEFIKIVYGSETLEENLDFIAKALDNKGNTSREIIRNYFVNDFYKEHLKTFQKRPIYWLYDSGRQDGFKALVYMHRYTADTTGIVRVDYLHKMQKIYMSEIDRMKEMAECSNNSKEIAQVEKRREKLIKQLKEIKEYDEKIAHIALSRIVIDLDDGIKVNYEKVQTGQDGKKLDILAKI